jgi:MoaA/NifB/PqqE/SkfB family radical SAM enzyme
MPVIDAGAKKASVLPLLDCNARCPFCSTRVYTDAGVRSTTDYREANDRRLKEYTQTLAEVERTYDELVAGGIERISLQGGEPTMWEPLPELLRYGRAKGVQEQTVVSNGRRFKDAAYTEALVAAGPDTIVLSLFGASAEIHDHSMGVRGAFTDVVAGVRHLVAATAGRPVSLMAQFSVHAHNHHELPEMFRFWYAQGLRSFTVRLLRETVNTQLHPGEDWFFDLAKLREPLERALDFVRTTDDVFCCFSEVFYCLVSPAYLGDVLRDVGSNPNLHATSLQVNRHFAGAVADARTRAGTERDPACTTCDLAPVCVRAEEPFRSRFSGELRSIAIEPQVRALVASGVTAARAAEAEALIEVDGRLLDAGVDRELVASLWRQTLATFDDPRALANRLLPPREQEALRTNLARLGGHPLRRRYRALSTFGLRGPLDGDPGKTLPRLVAEAPPEHRKALEFLRDRARVLAVAPTLVLFASPLREADGTNVVVLTALVDDRRIDEPTAWRLLAPFLETMRP